MQHNNNPPKPVGASVASNSSSLSSTTTTTSVADDVPSTSAMPSMDEQTKRLYQGNKTKQLASFASGLIWSRQNPDLRYASIAQLHAQFGTWKSRLEIEEDLRRSLTDKKQYAKTKDARVVRRRSCQTEMKELIESTRVLLTSVNALLDSSQIGKQPLSDTNKKRKFQSILSDDESEAPALKRVRDEEKNETNAESGPNEKNDKADSDANRKENGEITNDIKIGDAVFVLNDVKAKIGSAVVFHTDANMLYNGIKIGEKNCIIIPGTVGKNFKDEALVFPEGEIKTMGGAAKEKAQIKWPFNMLIKKNLGKKTPKI